MEKYTKDWFTPHIPLWEVWLRPFQDKPCCALEIGSYEGRSAVWLCENILTHPDSVLACVEPFIPYRGADNKRVKRWFLHNTQKHREDKRLFHYQARSFDWLPGHKETFDLIYIDGEHTVKGVAADAILSWPALKPGGRLIFDDYAYKVKNWAVKTAVDAFLSCIEGQYTLIGKEYQICIEKGADAS